ncbi:MAG: histidine phosphatase family protein [Rectinemataceae bacterium]|nr:histidine phosphatase family protein [Rectinemataceae bacterium]
MYPRFELAEGEKGGALSIADASAIVIDGAFFSSISHDTRFYILRHGQTAGNASATFQGRLDYPLDEIGLTQARAVGAWLAEKQIDAIVSSPQRRAAQTASIVAEACGKGEALYLPSLIEVDVGIFMGMDADTARVRHPEIFARFKHMSWDAVPEAEHSSSMYARAVASWIKMRELAESGARNIVCVSHGGLIQWLIRSTFGAKSWLPLMPTSNCGISRLDVEPTGSGSPAFLQWPMINFRAPGLGQGITPVF